MIDDMALLKKAMDAQDQRTIELWRRATASDEWSHSKHGPGDVVDLTSIACRLDVNELYDIAAEPAA